MPGYEYDSQMDQFISNDADTEQMAIKRDTAVRHKIITLRFEKNEYIALCSIED